MSRKSLKAEIADLMALRPGAEFALFFYGPSQGWAAHFVNSTGCVSLGEVGGDFEGEGETPEEAVRACAQAVRAYKPPRLPHDAHIADWADVVGPQRAAEAAESRASFFDGFLGRFDFDAAGEVRP